MTLDSNEPTWPFADPRMAGLREHYKRTEIFHALSKGCLDEADSFRLKLAGLYSARAIAEILLDQFKVKADRDNMEAYLRSQLPRYGLIECIRIHDFHRFGLIPPDSKFHMMTQGGPIKLAAQKGHAAYQLTPAGPKALTKGNATIKEQRPLLSRNSEFFDEDKREYVSLDQILTEFLLAVSKVIDAIEKHMKPNGDIVIPPVGS